MNDVHSDRPDDDLPDALRWQLRAMRQDAPPAVDLWPGIESRLHVAPIVRRRYGAPLALAASLMVAVGVFALAGSSKPDVEPSALTAANSLTRQYDSALHAMPDAKRAPELAPAIVELDRSAALIRRALSRDPDSRLLLDQLQRTYSLKLALSQRALMG